MNPEVFYIQVEGNQRGPYTVSQIDHLLNSNLITTDAQYWREGMEGWYPVTELVVLRKRTRRWLIPAILAGLAIATLLGAQILGPTIMLGWRETAQYEFTPHAAYWRARDMVRQKLLPLNAVVTFMGEKSSRVELQPEASRATVWLTGEVVNSTGKPMRRQWRVEMLFHRTAKEWTHHQAQEEPAS